MDNQDYFGGYAQDPNYDDDKPIVHLDDWSIVPGAELNPYQAPEMATVKLHGRVTGHPFHDDGTYVTTSTPQASYGELIETHNTIYELGRMSSGYGEWCFHNGIEVDPKLPFKFKTA